MPPPKPPQRRHANLTPQQIKLAIKRFEKRIDELRAFDANAMVSRSDPGFAGLTTRLKESLVQTFPEDTHEYVRHAGNLSIYEGPYNYAYEVTKHEWATAINDSKEEVVGHLQALVSSLNEQLEENEEIAPAAPAAKIDGERRVFIVHGHDEASKASVARTLEQLGLEAVILHELPNRGATIIEKLERHANCSFAVVLLTPDDEGRRVGDPELKKRARQNVVLELGYFVAKLGRENVCALYVPGVEIPSDFHGVAWHALDTSGAWRFQVAKELRAAGFSVDLNKL